MKKETIDQFKTILFLVIFLFLMIFVFKDTLFTSSEINSIYNEELQVNETIDDELSNSVNVEKIEYFDEKNKIFLESENNFFVSVGDKLGDMTVKSIAPFSYTNPDLIGPRDNNVKIKLTGPITITGMYKLLISEIGFTGYCMFDFDEASIKKLPSLSPTDKTDLFCFRNEDVVKIKLGDNQEKIKVTVVIDNFEMNNYPAEVVDWADLVEVVPR